MKLLTIKLHLLGLITYICALALQPQSTIIRPNNLTIGSLPDIDINQKTPQEIISGILNLNQTYIQFTRVENEESQVDSILLTNEMQPFINAVHLAYKNHLPLIITPDMIWYLVSNGVSTFINLNSEQMRNRFVSHDGKKKISVRRDDFTFGSSMNKWNETISEFSSKINELTNFDVQSLFESSFSTTSPESKIVSKIVLMDSMQKYFEFEFVTLCGIPEIRLLGNKRDWITVKNKITQLRMLINELDVWLINVDTILDHFIGAFEDSVDQTFWNQIYKVKGGSGGPYLSGWVTSLFPYLKNNSPNYYVWEKTWQDAYNDEDFGGLVTSDFPMNINKVPFKWNYLQQEFDMLFVGGMFGVQYSHVDKSLKTVFGYGVCEDKLNKVSRHSIEK